MITQTQKDTLNEYAKIKSEIKILEEKADEYNTQVLEIMQSNELGEVELTIGKLSLGSRRTWKYGPEIVEKEESLKSEKKIAEQTGVGATYVEKSYVLFKGNKE